MIACKYIGKTVKVKIDRPINSLHPKHGFVYEVNYGYVPDTISGDGEELDAYILGINEPVDEFEGVCIAVIHRTNDNDDKLVIVPKAISFSDEQITELTNFQEKWFKSVIIRNSNITRYHFGVYGVAKQGDKILVIKKARGPYTGLYDLPGGSPEESEDEAMTLYREIKEETGCAVVSFDNMRNKQVVFSDFTKASGEKGVLFHQASLFDVDVRGDVFIDSDGQDSSRAQWVDIANLDSDNATPLLLIGAGKEVVSIADENNNAIGCIVKGNDLPDNRYGMIAGVLVFNSVGNVILHKIASHKTWAGLWTYSAAGHVDAGESYEEAAIREAKEELGVDIKIESLIAEIPFYRNGNHTGFHKVYKAVSDGPYFPDKNEIAEIKEFSMDELNKMTSMSPERCFPELISSVTSIV